MPEAGEVLADEGPRPPVVDGDPARVRVVDRVGRHEADAAGAGQVGDRVRRRQGEQGERVDVGLPDEGQVGHAVGVVCSGSSTIEAVRSTVAARPASRLTAYGSEKAYER